MIKQDYKRIAKIEAIANAHKAEQLSTMRDTYDRSCLEGDIDSAAEFARKVRDKLLSETDWTQVVDSPLTESVKLQWASYRQELRDIPEQAGFPLVIEWPLEP